MNYSIVRIIHLFFNCQYFKFFMLNDFKTLHLINDYKQNHELQKRGILVNDTI